MPDDATNGVTDGESPPKGLSIRMNMFWNSAGSITYLVFQWLITIFIVRMSHGNFGPAGVLALAMAVYNIFQPVALYRMYTYQVSDVRRENSVGEYVAFRLLTCGIALGACAVYSAVTAPGALVSILLYSLFKVCSLLIDVLHGNDQLNGRMDYIGKSLMLQGVSTFIAFAGVFLLASNIDAAFVAMAVVTVAVGLFYDLPRTRRFGPIQVGISREKAFYLLRYCLPIVVAAIAVSAAPAIPRQYLSHLEGTEALGIYASIAAPVSVIQMGASYIYNPLLSVFSTEYSYGRTRQLMRTFLAVIGGIAAIGVICAISLKILGPWLFTLLLGEGIRPYLYLLQPIVVTTIISAYVWFFSDLLVALRDFRASFVGNVVSLVVTLPASYFFVRQWGMNGVSFTSIAAYGVGVILMGIALVRVIRRGPDHVLAASQPEQ